MDVSNLPVFDEFAALRLVEGDRDLLQEILALFTEIAPDLLAEIRTGELEAVRCAAHSLKGSAANVCAERLRAICGAVEQHAKNGERDAVTALTDAVGHELQTFLEIANPVV